MDWLTIITTLAASFLPAAVSISNNISQTKQNEQNNKYQLELNKQKCNHEIQLKQLDYYYSDFSSSVVSYLNNLYAYLDNQSNENHLKYQKSMIKVSIVAPKNVYSYIDTINEYIKSGNIKQVKNTLVQDLIDALNKEAHHDNN